MSVKTLGIMIDCSRNGVMSPGKVKEFASLISGMGYNMLMLYTEDTYEIAGEPFFGYMRGRYTADEIRDIDAHCRSVGIELIPCIQTLAHLNQVRRWPGYASLFDIGDILMAGDPAVYDFIDKMFSSVSQCFTSRRIHIGMDEAYMLGRGRYLDKNGSEDRTLIMRGHLAKVAELAGKYGLTPMMWSDMFSNLCTDGATVPQDLKDAVPAGVELVYWDYYSTDIAHYDAKLSIHEQFTDNPTVFAGGIWTWTGFSPNLSYSLKAVEASVKGLEKHPGVETVFYTMWGDNGKECSTFSALPAIFAAAEMTRGNFDMESIAAEFEKRLGYSFDEFMMLELPNVPGADRVNVNNPCKYLLYNDPFIGLFDFTVAPDLAKLYAEAVGPVEACVNGRRFDYLFDFAAKLLRVLSVKCDLGIRIRQAYSAGDREALLRFADTELPSLVSLVDELYRAFRTMWLTDNKAFGLEVCENRFGGLMLRLRSCADRIRDYLAGNIAQIDELEARQEAFLPDSREKAINFNYFTETYTACID